MTPCFSRSAAIWPTRFRWSSRSARVNPVPGKRLRMLSPSSRSTSTFRSASSRATSSAIVLFPDPDRPVNHSTAGLVVIPCFAICRYLLCFAGSAAVSL